LADLFSLAQAERQAVNTKIQGSAADLVKTAVILLNRSLKEKLACVHLVHQIHDELLFQVSSVELKIKGYLFHSICEL
jgi:DNA polymerase I-like protein with 3'-5' exonuclease and polymerase domains